VTSTDKALTAFAIVFVSSALWPNLPHVSLIIIGVLAISAAKFLSLPAHAIGAILGFVWAASMGYWYTDGQFDKRIFNQNVIVEGVISSISVFDPTDSNHDPISSLPEQVRINIKLERIGKRDAFTMPEVRISWYRPSHLPKQGQRFRFLVNLKAPNGLANPHTFHYQTWLASKNVVATGYILPSPSNQLLNAKISTRQRSIDQLSAINLSNTPWLQALSFGYRGELSDDDWELLQKSGTAHLFAISGLHVGIVFGYSLWLFSKPTALALSMAKRAQHHATKATSIIAACICLVYAYLAGFQVPVLRALLALMLWTYLLASGSHWRLLGVLLYLLVTFFILFPYAILGISFWFSFIAVMSIWLFIWRFTPKDTLSFLGKLKYTFYLQIWLSMVTLPLTLYVFHQLPLFALLANVMLVPWVSIVLVPLCLIGSILMLLQLPSRLYTPVFELADKAMELTLWVMQQTVRLADAFSIKAPSVDAATLGLCGLLIALALAPFWHSRRVMITLCLVAIIIKLQLKPLSSTKLIVFDVGQGSSSLLIFNQDNQQHHYLFDTGQSFASGFSMAESVLLPYMKKNRIVSVDNLFLSHLDNDHAGGAAAIVDSLAVLQLSSPQHHCVSDSLWSKISRADGLQFEVLWPLAAQSGHENQHSCVVKTVIQGVSILFAGDIELRSEQALVDLYAGSNKLSSDILIAPHHGSRTSSTPAFVRAVSPQYTIFTAAHPNRWGFPHKDVVARYQKAGSVILQTGKQGALEFEIHSGAITLRTYRHHQYNRWYFKAPD
jgi:competence protein ComEC